MEEATLDKLVRISEEFGLDSVIPSLLVALVTFIATQLYIKYIRNPKLKISFNSSKRPFYHETTTTTGQKLCYLRLGVRNYGKVLAKNVQGRLLAAFFSEEDSADIKDFKTVLYDPLKLLWAWEKNDTLTDLSPQMPDVFLDLLFIQESNSAINICLKHGYPTYFLPILKKPGVFIFKVGVFADNAVPQIRSIKVSWDQEFESGFDAEIIPESKTPLLDIERPSEGARRFFATR